MLAYTMLMLVLVIGYILYKIDRRENRAAREQLMARKRVVPDTSILILREEE